MAVDTLEVVNIATTGSEQTYTVPSDAARLKIKPSGTAVDLMHESGGATFNIADGDVLTLDTRTIRRDELYLNAASGSQSIEIVILKGVLS